VKTGERGALIAPPPDPRAAESASRLEALIGVDPRETLDKLRDAQQETAKLRRREAEVVANLATYEARFSHPSHWEHERKALLSRLSGYERSRLLTLGVKFTEAMLDEYGHAHGEYRDFLDQGKRERERMEALRAELSEVRGRIEIAKGVEVYYERHCRLNDSLVWHSSKELGLTRT
jgi:hypothetical protein